MGGGVGENTQIVGGGGGRGGSGWGVCDSGDDAIYRRLTDT